MCVIYFAFEPEGDQPLVLLANRDEFYDRPSLAAGYWEDHPHIFGGRDLVGGGTWLGVTTSGRFAAVTNYRDPYAPAGNRSRGELVSEFLKSRDAAGEYFSLIATRANDYSGFNLLVGEISSNVREIHYYSNRGGEPRSLDAGVYGLSNHLLDTAWPKVTKGKERFAELLRNGTTDEEAYFHVLADEELANDNDLPSTGVPYEIEKAISAIFIKTPGYGTRCSTILTFDRDLKWDMTERVFV
jgi:uncharacterized protein with NRDE domain